MLRRPAPALAPAAWLLLAGLLCGGGVWAARGKRRGRVGTRGLSAGSRVGTRGSGPGARLWVAAQEAVGARCRRRGEAGRLHRTRAGLVAARIWGDVQKGRSVGQSSSAAPAGWGGIPGVRYRVRVLCAEMCIRPGLHAQFLVCAYIRAHFSASFPQIPIICCCSTADAASAPFSASFQGLLNVFWNEPRLKLLAPLPPFHPKVKL